MKKKKKNKRKEKERKGSLLGRPLYIKLEDISILMHMQITPQKHKKYQKAKQHNSSKSPYSFNN
jgi:hypothetical protein